MKILTFLALFLGAQSYAQVSIVCEPGPYERPYDLFIIDFTGQNTADVKFERHVAYGSGEVSPQRMIRGCRQAFASCGPAIDVVCAGNGAAGIFQLHEVGIQRYAGFVYFPEGNIGYGPRTRIEVTCRGYGFF